MSVGRAAAMRDWLRVVALLVRKEFLQVFRDKATVFQVFFIPVVQLLILSNAATFDVPQARLAVADADGSSTSAALMRRSVPSPPRMESLPSWPVTLSLPAPAFTVSLPP